MDSFDAKTSIMKLISSNKNGVTTEDIIEYLDYVNKVRYSVNEIDRLLQTLLEEKKILKVANNWCSLK